jgi:AraC-like DNA-binding protein
MSRAPHVSVSRGGTVSVVLVRPLVVALAGRPGAEAALADFYAATDLTPEILADADARVSPAQLCVAWAAAVRLAGDPELALGIADATPPGAFGVVEYICRSAPTLGGGLSQWCRYLRILDDAVRVALVLDGGRASLRVVTESEAPAPASHELCFALVVRHARAMVDGPLRVHAVAFAHQGAKAQRERYAAYFGAPVRFGAEVTELVFEAADVDRPLRTQDPNLVAVLLPAAEAALARESVTAPLTDQVRRALRAALVHSDAQLEAVAKRLGMTPRSLQRRLKDEGTVFQTLRDELRKDLADRYLGEGMSFAEISFLLGFSEPSAFFRAFKRWTGLTPFERRLELSEA